MKKIVINIYSWIWRIIRGIKDFLMENYDRCLFRIDLRSAEIFPEIFRQKICIVVPHVDDEILGMGGLLTALDGNGNDILIIYTTDGSKSYHPHYNEEMMKKKRVKEAEQIRQEFSNVNICFMHGKSMEWDIDCAKKKLLQIILRFSPQFIFFPAEYDRNLDHVKNAVCLGTCVGDDLNGARFFSFSVQTPLKKISCYYPMSECELKKKIKCLDLYKSQEVMEKSFKKVILFNELCAKKSLKKGAYGIEVFEEFTIEQMRDLASANVTKLHQEFPILTYGKSIRRVNQKCIRKISEK